MTPQRGQSRLACDRPQNKIYYMKYQVASVRLEHAWKMHPLTDY
jgi:hypothetical protein